MLHSLPPQPMYSPTGIHFRNPFIEQRPQSRYNHDFNHPLSSTEYNTSKSALPLHRPITPPPEMNTVATNLPHSQNLYYGDRSAAPLKYEMGQSKYEVGAFDQSQALSNQQAKQEPFPESVSRPRSPVFTQNPNTGGPRRTSQVNSIAPSLQIPRSVNNSQGSLAELAAQITCLFWFESSITLDRAEASVSCNAPLQTLAQDATPTTGFRKWVTTILSTTQVAQNVIILALLFIYRLKKLNPTVKGKPGSEYRLLTVALMLGNKFLDDNTYTNKTWAEVSGISVAEVHIMEVEFLSNMKYALFTSAEEWANWQTQLGRFASFFDQASHASRMPVSHSVAGALGITLPSPPTSNHSSPSYSAQMSLYGSQHPSSGIAQGHTPNPSPLGAIPELHSQSTRKRSLDDYSAEAPSKRMATSTYGNSFPSATPISTTVPPYNQSQFLPRVPLPSLAIPHPHQSVQPSPVRHHHQQQHFVPQLPPLNHQQHHIGAAPNTTSTWPHPTTSAAASLGRYSHTPMQMTPIPPSIPHSRHQSPYPGSANVSPSNGALQPAGHVHSAQMSPSYYLEQRNSPYRPIRGVSTLLVPPPSGTTQQPQHIERDQMHYQPLGRPQERQTGQLPYIAQNQWFDDQHQSSASAYQWPSFMPSHHQQQQHSAHSQLPLPTPTFGRA